MDRPSELPKVSIEEVEAGGASYTSEVPGMPERRVSLPADEVESGIGKQAADEADSGAGTRVEDSGLPGSKVSFPADEAGSGSRMQADAPPDSPELKVSLPADAAESGTVEEAEVPGLPGPKVSLLTDEVESGAGMPAPVPLPPGRKEEPGSNAGEQAPAPPHRKKFTRAWSRLASGHAAKGTNQAMFVPPTGPGAQPTELHKELIEAELEIYRKVNSDDKEPDSILPFLPQFRGVTEDKTGKHWVVMGNLLYGFGHSKVMDVKLGVRTFVEAEADSQKARNDLYKKFLNLYPEQLTEEERTTEAVTKFRYMSISDEMSTSSQCGFRIDGIAGYATRRPTELREEARKFSTLHEARGAFRMFATAMARGVEPEEEEEEVDRLIGVCGDEGPRSSKRKGGLSLVLEHASTSDLASEGHLATSRALLEQLRSMRVAFESSEFLRTHECLGTSVLLVADNKCRGGAFWIDFAKTRPLPEGLVIDHRSPWQLGNHEDGVILGLDCLVEVWESLVAEFQAEADEEHEILMEARASMKSKVSVDSG